jgi:hypothetical protein
MAGVKCLKEMNERIHGAKKTAYRGNAVNRFMLNI